MNTARFWLLHGVLPVLLFLPLAYAFEHTPFDLWVADHFYDAGSGYWLGGGSWWAKGLIHTGGARLIILLFVASLLLWAASYRHAQYLRWRRPALFVGLGIVLATTLVAVLKHYTNVDCPEVLTRYGGEQLYAHVFSARPQGAGRGGCFPGGHSSGAFSLATVYFLLRERRPGWALPGLAGVFLLGMIYAFGQWARGEHFPSHDAWSALVCWYVVLALYALAFRGRIFGNVDTC